jgi:hypothetical protein
VVSDLLLICVVGKKHVSQYLLFCLSCQLWCRRGLP